MTSSNHYIGVDHTLRDGASTTARVLKGLGGAHPHITGGDLGHDAPVDGETYITCCNCTNGPYCYSVANRCVNCSHDPCQDCEWRKT